MDLELIDARIQILIESRDSCNCQSRQGRQLREIADMLIENYQNLRLQILEALADGFLTNDCDNASYD